MQRPAAAATPRPAAAVLWPAAAARNDDPVLFGLFVLEKK